MCEPPSSSSRTFEPGSLPWQGIRSAPSGPRSFADWALDGFDALLAGPRPGPPRRLDRPITQIQTCTQTLCLPGGDPSGDHASRTQPAHCAADPAPVGCPPTLTGVPEEAL